MPDRDPDPDRPQRRPVRSDDPSLSDEANRMLTDEARAIIGRDEVDVPASRADPAHRRHARHSGFVADLIAERVGYVITALAAIVVLAVIALVTGSAIVLIAAIVVLVVATLAVVIEIMRLAGETEHLSPEASEELEAEGVGDPDRVLTDLVKEFTEEEDAPRGRDDDPPPPWRR
ncbi:MAG TPA: hypothetical protein VGM33_25980 [Baekduia sp.]|jgi:hypothetical protein